MTSYDVIQKLIGPINPVGETYTDEKRFSNLEETIILVDKLLFDIDQIVHYRSRAEHSMKKAGARAADFMREIQES